MFRLMLLSGCIAGLLAVSCSQESPTSPRPPLRKNGAGVGATPVTSADSAYFIVKDGIQSFFKVSTRNASELGAEACPLKAGKKYTYTGKATLESKHYRFQLTESEPNCTFGTGYVFAEHITLGGKEPQEQNSAQVNSPFCQYSWEEKPGTTDYTTFDAYHGRSTQGDRPQNQTLIGSGVQANRSLCEKARALQHCFERTVAKSTESSAVRFREWASARGIDPVLALIAKTEQETKIGTIPDSCINGSCNGIGIGQIITAIDANGNVMSNNDPRWDGITFNILTNLTHSVRVIAQKIPRANSLRSLAYYYNGSASASAYADKVVGYYDQLKQCGLR